VVINRRHRLNIREAIEDANYGFLVLKIINGAFASALQLTKWEPHWDHHSTPVSSTATEVRSCKEEVAELKLVEHELAIAPAEGGGS